MNAAETHGVAPGDDRFGNVRLVHTDDRSGVRIAQVEDLRVHQVHVQKWPVCHDGNRAGSGNLADAR